jgi:hypothetical protein
VLACPPPIPRGARAPRVSGAHHHHSRRARAHARATRSRITVTCRSRTFIGKSPFACIRTRASPRRARPVRPPPQIAAQRPQPRRFPPAQHQISRVLCVSTCQTTARSRLTTLRAVVFALTSDGVSRCWGRGPFDCEARASRFAKRLALLGNPRATAACTAEASTPPQLLTVTGGSPPLSGCGREDDRVGVGSTLPMRQNLLAHAGDSPLHADVLASTTVEPPVSPQHAPREPVQAAPFEIQPSQAGVRREPLHAMDHPHLRLLSVYLTVHGCARSLSGRTGGGRVSGPQHRRRQAEAVDLTRSRSPRAQAGGPRATRCGTCGNSSASFLRAPSSSSASSPNSTTCATT